MRTTKKELYWVHLTALRAVPSLRDFSPSLVNPETRRLRRRQQGGRGGGLWFDIVVLKIITFYLFRIP